MGYHSLLQRIFPSKTSKLLNHKTKKWNFSICSSMEDIILNEVSQTEKDKYHISSVQFSSLQSLSHVWLFVTPLIAACQASLSITNSQSLLKLMSIKSVMLSNHLILCQPLLLLPSIFPSIRVFFNESVLGIRWPKYRSFSISPSNDYSGLISFRIDWLDFLAM